MSHQTLPSLATAIRYTAGTERRGDLAPPTSPFLTEGRLSVDATRELAKCANGEHVSHDVIRDGIDALLLMKRGSFDHSVSQDARDYGEWRTGPEYPPALPAVQTPVWHAVSYEEKREIESSSDESDAEEQRRHKVVAAEAPVVKKNVKPRKKPEGRKTASNKKPLHLPPPPVNRPPTIWHTRKPELLPPPALPTPDSPKSKISLEEDSPEPQDEPSDEDADEEIGPATLHFSCIQCHRAKKRCNRTRPCSRCSSRGMDHQCSYPDKHDPRSVLRACLRCWQTKKKCDRKQPCCGKCEKVGVKCLYRRESAAESPEATAMVLQMPTPTMTLSPPPTVVMSRHSSDASTVPQVERNSRKRKNSDDSTSDPPKATKRTTSNSLGRRASFKEESDNDEDKEIEREVGEFGIPKRSLRSRK